MATAASNAIADPSQRRYRGCAKITDYEITDKLGEGTFGVVSKGVSKRTGAVVALKKILMHNEKDGFPITALREIKLLKMLSHPNVVRLDEMAVERKAGDGKKRATMYMITPYMDHDLSGMTTNPDIQFTLPQIKCYMLQLLEGLRYLHEVCLLGGVYGTLLTTAPESHSASGHEGCKHPHQQPRSIADCRLWSCPTLRWTHATAWAW